MILALPDMAEWIEDAQAENDAVEGLEAEF